MVRFERARRDKRWKKYCAGKAKKF